MACLSIQSHHFLKVSVENAYSSLTRSYLCLYLRSDVGDAAINNLGEDLP